MTEEQIERRVEALTDALDRKFMRHEFTQAEYDLEIKKIDRWADNAYRSASKAA